MTQDLRRREENQALNDEKKTSNRSHTKVKRITFLFFFFHSLLVYKLDLLEIRLQEKSGALKRLKCALCDRTSDRAHKGAVVYFMARRREVLLGTL